MSEFSATDMLMRELDQCYVSLEIPAEYYKAAHHLLEKWDETGQLTEWEYNIAEALVMMALEEGGDD